MMTVFETPQKAPDDKQLRRAGAAGIAIGALAILACELPIILIFLGLSGLSAGAMALRPLPIVEMAAIIIAFIGGTLLVFVATRRFIKRQKGKWS